MNQQNLFGQLNRLGVNTQDALERFMGNEELLLSFFCKLPEKMDFTAPGRTCPSITSTFSWGTSF